MKHISVKISKVRGYITHCLEKKICFHFYGIRSNHKKQKNQTTTTKTLTKQKQTLRLLLQKRHLFSSVPTACDFPFQSFASNLKLYYNSQTFGIWVLRGLVKDPCHQIGLATPGVAIKTQGLIITPRTSTYLMVWYIYLS